MAFSGQGAGTIQVVCGPMFSGKSEELIRRLQAAEKDRRRIQVFKPSLDSRYSPNEIVTHGGSRLRAEPVHSAEELGARLQPGTEVIGIDEANFFGLGLTRVATQLADTGKEVIVGGLDMDYLGRPFPPVPDLLAIAGSVTKLQAVCARCGAAAEHSQRLIESRELILVGAVDLYEARCRFCFEPHCP